MFIFNWIFKSLVSWVMSYVLYGLGVLYIVEKASSEFGYELDVFDMFRDQIMGGVGAIKDFAEGKVKDQVKSSIGLSLFGNPGIPKNINQMKKMSGDNLRKSLGSNPTEFDKFSEIGGNYKAQVV